MAGPPGSTTRSEVCTTTIDCNRVLLVMFGASLIDCLWFSREGRWRHTGAPCGFGGRKWRRWSCVSTPNLPLLVSYGSVCERLLVILERGQVDSDRAEVEADWLGTPLSRREQ